MADYVKFRSKKGAINVMPDSDTASRISLPVTIYAYRPCGRPYGRIRMDGHRTFWIPTKQSPMPSGFGVAMICGEQPTPPNSHFNICFSWA